MTPSERDCEGLPTRTSSVGSAMPDCVQPKRDPLYPFGHQLPTLCSERTRADELILIECWASSFVLDFHARLLSNGHVMACSPKNGPPEMGVPR